eukprot:378216_1
MLFKLMLLSAIQALFGQQVVWKPMTERINITEPLLPYFNNTGEKYTYEICNILPWKNLNAIIDRNKYNYWYSYYEHWSYTVEINETNHQQWILESTNFNIFTPSLTQFDKNDNEIASNIPYQIESSLSTPSTPVAQEGIYTCSQIEKDATNSNIAYCYVKYGSEQGRNNTKSFFCRIYYNKFNKWSNEIEIIIDWPDLLRFQIVCFNANFAFIYAIPFPPHTGQIRLINYYLIDFYDGYIQINNNTLFATPNNLVNYFKVVENKNNLLFYINICAYAPCFVFLKTGYYHHSILNPYEPYKIEMTENEYIIDNRSMQSTTRPIVYNDNNDKIWIVPVTFSAYDNSLMEIYLFDENLYKINQIHYVVEGYYISFQVISLQMLNNDNDDFYFSIISYNSDWINPIAYINVTNYKINKQDYDIIELNSFSMYKSQTGIVTFCSCILPIDNGQHRNQIMVSWFEGNHKYAPSPIHLLPYGQLWQITLDG